MKNRIIKEFIEEIIPTIEMIDSGCPDCISEFCDSINTTLSKHYIKLVYSEDYPIRVSLKKMK